MKKYIFLAALLASVSLGQAQTYSVTLDPAQAATVIGGRTGSGIGSLTLSGSTLSLNVTFNGLSHTFSADHIHGPAAQSPTTTASVLYGLGGITTVAAGGLSGTINGNVNLVAGTGGFDLATQMSQLNSGLWYVNIHTSGTGGFPGGEIRGQILPVPEPSSLAICVLGLGGLLAWRVRRFAA